MNIMLARVEKLCELLGIDGAAPLRRYHQYPGVRKRVNALFGEPELQRKVGTCYRRAQVARALGVASKTVKRWLKNGTIFGVRGPNGELLIPESEVRRVAAERKHIPKRKYRKRDKVYWRLGR